MDPLSAFGLLGSVISIVTFASSLTVETYRFTKSSSQSSPENEWLQAQAERSKTLSDELSSAGSTETTAVDAKTLRLAKDCQDEADKLIALLNSLKLPVRPDGTKSKRLAVKQVLRSKVRTGDVEASRRRLESLEKQLSSAVIACIKQSQSVDFEKIQSTLSQHGNELTIGNEALKRVEEEILKARAHLEDTKAREFAKVIMNALDFPQRASRDDMIEDRHWTTFNWALSEGAFKYWLEGAEKTFWICGHPGSGKSTLMKYLAQNLLSSNSLHAATTQCDALVARHFFWIAGHPLQKKILTMLQNLMYQLISARPTLARIAFPNKLQPTLTPSEDDLVKSFHYIARSMSVRMILVIDGLDECEERNHHDLLRIIRKLASMDNIRMVLSSRPWAIFEQDFDRSTPKLLLQSLTRSDMYRYTCNRLQSADPSLGLSGYKENDSNPDLKDSTSERDDNGLERFTGCNDLDSARHKEAVELVSNIVEKADGVFFWVSLVLDTLCVRLVDGHSLLQLQRFVDEFPRKLEDYFDKLVYERIADTYRNAAYSETAMALHIALLGTRADEERANRRYGITTNMSYLNFWVLRESVLTRKEIITDASFGTHASFGVHNRDEREAMEVTSRYLAGCCKDFLRMRDSVVTFRHRTGHDFLHTQRMQDLIKNHTPPHFHDKPFWKQLTLCRLKFDCEDPSEIYEALMEEAFRNAHHELSAFPRLGPQYYEEYFLDWMDILDADNGTDAIRYFAENVWLLNELIFAFIEENCYTLAARIIKLAPVSSIQHQPAALRSPGHGVWAEFQTHARIRRSVHCAPAARTRLGSKRCIEEEGVHLAAFAPQDVVEDASNAGFRFWQWLNQPRAGNGY